MKKCLFLLIINLSFNVIAQTTIEGLIKDYDTREGLPGVNVFIPEIQKGTITDINGRYELYEIPRGLIKIQFSFIGYHTLIKTIEVKFDTLNINAELQKAFVEAQEIIITGGKAGAQHENAIKIECIKKENLENSSTQNIIEKLNIIPGIDAISKGHGIASPVIRGLSTTNIVILNNGIRMENFQFSENHPYTIDDSDVSKIEIIKGPASLLYGSDAVGGVLNFVKEEPAPVNKIKGIIKTNYNTNYNGFTSSIGLKGSSNNFFGGIKGYINSAKDYTDGNGINVPNTRNSTHSIKLCSGYRKSFGLFKIYYDYNKLTPGLTISLADSIINDNDRLNHVWYQDLNNHLLTSKNIFFFNKLRLDIDISTQINNRKLHTTENTPVVVDMKLVNYTYQMKARYDFSEKNNLIITTQGLFQFNKNGNAPNHVLPNYSLTSNSLAGLWQYVFNNKIFYQVGIRYDNKIIDVPGQYKSNNTTDWLEKFQHTYNNFSFSTGFTYKISKLILLRGNLASAHRTPAIAELTQDGIHANRYEQGNRTLKSQRNIEGDLSLHYHSTSFKAEIAGFYNQIYNYIFMAPTQDSTQDGLQIYRYLQNNASLLGLETEVEYSFTKWINIWANYSHINAKQENGNNLPYIPQDKLNAGVNLIKSTYKNLNNIKFSINSQIALKQNNPHEFETITNGYFLLNAVFKTSIKISKQMIETGIGIYNICNTAYTDHLSTLKSLGYYNMGKNFSFNINIPF